MCIASTLRRHHKNTSQMHPPLSDCVFLRQHLTWPLPYFWLFAVDKKCVCFGSTLHDDAALRLGFKGPFRTILFFSYLRAKRKDWWRDKKEHQKPLIWKGETLAFRQTPLPSHAVLTIILIALTYSHVRITRILLAFVLQHFFICTLQLPQPKNHSLDRFTLLSRVHRPNLGNVCTPAFLHLH